MLILTMEETLGLGKQGARAPITQKTVALATTLSLGRAIGIIKAYEKAYSEAFASSGAFVEFRLLSVSELDRECLTHDVLDSVGVAIVEKFPQTPERVRSSTELA